MAELKAGGLAIIIKSGYPENVGKVVTTVKFVGDNSYFDNGILRKEYNVWVINRDGNLMTSVGGVEAGVDVFAHAGDLLPIDGDNFPMEVLSKEKVDVA